MARTKTILIQTLEKDVHAAAVTVVLRRLGFEVVLSVSTDVPTRQSHSFSINVSDPRYALRRFPDEAEQLLGERIDLIWHRRGGLYGFPEMHPDDKPIAEREFKQFLDGFWYHAAPNAVEVNPWGPRIRASSKLVQLQAAHACGLNVSPTLVSNDPGRIQAFLADQGIENCIFKTFRPAGWREPDGRGFSISTTRLAPGKCDDLASLRLAPGIYQRYVEKARELRVTVMGERIYTAQIDASHVSGAETDWRVARGDLNVYPEALPVETEDKIRRLMRELNLKFGCVDLILSPDGDYYFLEINEMGQFLWIERKNPRIPLLSHFAGFICDELGVAADWSNISYEECRGSREYEDVLAEISHMPVSLP